MNDNYYVTTSVKKGSRPISFTQFKVEDYGIKPNEDYVGGHGCKDILYVTPTGLYKVSAKQYFGRIASENKLPKIVLGGNSTNCRHKGGCYCALRVQPNGLLKLESEIDFYRKLKRECRSALVTSDIASGSE